MEDSTRHVEKVSTQAGYDRWAEIYDADDNPLVRIETARVLELCGDVRGLRVVDIGCGTGRHAVAMAERGAAVVGFDFSDGMLSRAREKAGALLCELADLRPGALALVQHDLAQPLPAPEAAADRVLSCLVLDHVRDLEGAFREMRRVCRPDGTIVVSVLHPAMMLRGVQARFTDPRSGAEVRPESIANQISDYVMAALRAGLTIRRLSEHAIDQTIAAASPRAEKYLGWPILLLMGLSPA